MSRFINMPDRQMASQKVFLTERETSKVDNEQSSSEDSSSFHSSEIQILKKSLDEMREKYEKVLIERDGFLPTIKSMEGEMFSNKGKLEMITIKFRKMRQSISDKKTQVKQLKRLRIKAKNESEEWKKKFVNSQKIGIGNIAKLGMLKTQIKDLKETNQAQSELLHSLNDKLNEFKAKNEAKLSNEVLMEEMNELRQQMITDRERYEAEIEKAKLSENRYKSIMIKGVMAFRRKLNEIAQMKEENKNLKEHIDEKDAELNELRETECALKKLTESDIEQIEILTEQLRKNEPTKDSKSLCQNDDLIKQIEEQKKVINELRENDKKYDEEMVNLRAENNENWMDLKAARNRNGRLEMIIDTLKSKMDALKPKSPLQNSKNELEMEICELKNKLREHQMDCSDFRILQENDLLQIGSMNMKNDALNKQINAQIKTIKCKNMQIEECKQLLALRQDNIQKTNEKLGLLQNKMKTKQLELSNKRKIIKNLRKELNEIKISSES